MIITSNTALRLEAAAELILQGERADSSCGAQRAWQIMLRLVAGAAEGLNGLPNDLPCLSRRDC
jgi:hypothetical protein